MISEGLWLVLWGMFKKVAIADNLAPLVEIVFGNPLASGPMVLLGTVAFAFQIYGDFSGYSDIARGLARFLGFELTVNFNLPYLATDLRDFWRRWHISLSSWLRDYLYISLGGNRKGARRTAVNLLLTMLLGGLWHGAAWNFVLWGAWHGLGLLGVRWWQRRAVPRRLPAWIAVPFTFLFVLYGWLLFRATSLEQIGHMTMALTNWSAPAWLGHYLVSLLVFVSPLLLIGGWQKKSNDLLAPLRAPGWLQGVVHGLLLLGILLFWEKKSVPFIYFQF
jgi:D-alanyl-lipoteichoic acid acyltransferase DltB (MBOAT superfamily)